MRLLGRPTRSAPLGYARPESLNQPESLFGENHEPFFQHHRPRGDLRFHANSSCTKSPAFCRALLRERQGLTGVCNLARGGNVFAVSVTLPFAEAEQRQASGRRAFSRKAAARMCLARDAANQKTPRANREGRGVRREALAVLPPLEKHRGEQPGARRPDPPFVRSLPQDWCSSVRRPRG